MRFINKAGGGGPAWDSFAATVGARFTDAPKDAKDELRLTLARQQGFLCAFCQARLNIVVDAEGNIVSHETKIAHLISQAAPLGAGASEEDRRRQLSVSQRNVVLACLGINKPYSHCDDKQGNRDVTIPFENSGLMSASFQYHADGLLINENGVYREQIGAGVESNDAASVLNLNNPTLRRRRAEALDAVAELLKRQNDYTTANLEAKLSVYTEPNLSTGRMQSYCEWIAAFLRRKIRSNAQSSTPVRVRRNNSGRR